MWITHKQSSRAVYFHFMTGIYTLTVMAVFAGKLSLRAGHRVHTEWQQLSGIHFSMMVKLAQGWWVGGWTPTPFHYIYHHVKVAVYGPAERADTITLFHLYPYMCSVVQTNLLTNTEVLGTPSLLGGWSTHPNLNLWRSFSSLSDYLKLWITQTKPTLLLTFGHIFPFLRVWQDLVAKPGIGFTFRWHTFDPLLNLGYTIYIRKFFC